jgi:DNA-binding IscR family transcriptional regulator
MSKRNSIPLVVPDDHPTERCDGGAQAGPELQTWLSAASLPSLTTRGEIVPNFVDSALKDIDERLRTLKDETSRLEAARAALTRGPRRQHRSSAGSSARTRGRAAARRTTRSGAARSGSGGGKRAEQALELVRNQPGITIPEIAQAMKIQPNYLYRVLPGLASAGQIKREGQGWHPAAASASDGPATRSSRRPRATRSTSTGRAAGTRSRQRASRSTAASNGRTAHGATKASVLAALGGGEAMTASQVAAKAGLARPTVSTTLSKLAKSGEVQKAERGYRLGKAA